MGTRHFQPALTDQPNVERARYIGIA